MVFDSIVENLRGIRRVTWVDFVSFWIHNKMDIIMDES